MREGTRLWRQTIVRARAVLLGLDPSEPLPDDPDGDPDDRYAEAEAIARNLLTDGSVDVRALDAIWLHLYGQTLTEIVGPTRAAQLASDLTAPTPPRSHART